MTDDRLDLVVLLVELLDEAQTELAQLAEMPMPLGDDVLKQLEAHDAMKATLRRLIEGSADPQKVRADAEAIYRVEMARATRTDDGPKCPVREELLKELAELGELLRRRAIGDRQLGDALREVVRVGDLAGC